MRLKSELYKKEQEEVVTHSLRTLLWVKYYQAFYKVQLHIFFTEKVSQLSVKKV